MRRLGEAKAAARADATSEHPRLTPVERLRRSFAMSAAFMSEANLAARVDEPGGGFLDCMSGGDVRGAFPPPPPLAPVPCRTRPVRRAKDLLEVARREDHHRLHPGVRAKARHRVGVELLGDVGLDRVHAQGGWRDACKGQRVLGDHDLRLAEDGITECHVDAKRASVDLAREAALGTESNAVVLRPLVLKLGGETSSPPSRPRWSRSEGCPRWGLSRSAMTTPALASAGGDYGGANGGCLV